MPTISSLITIHEHYLHPLLSKQILVGTSSMLLKPITVWILSGKDRKMYNLVLLTPGDVKLRYDTWRGQRALCFLMPRCRSPHPSHCHPKGSTRPPRHLAEKAALLVLMKVTAVFIYLSGKDIARIPAKGFPPQVSVQKPALLQSQ